jgi:hypothetical protein
MVAHWVAKSPGSSWKTSLRFSSKSLPELLVFAGLVGVSMMGDDDVAVGGHAMQVKGVVVGGQEGFLPIVLLGSPLRAGPPEYRLSSRRFGENSQASVDPPANVGRAAFFS